MYHGYRSHLSHVQTPTRILPQVTITGFLIQPNGLPERMIGAQPAYYLTEKLKRWSASDINSHQKSCPSTFAVSAIRKPFGHPAKIIERRRALTCGMMKKIWTRRFAVRCSCYGAPKGLFIGPTMYWRFGGGTPTRWKTRFWTVGIFCRKKTGGRGVGTPRVFEIRRMHGAFCDKLSRTIVQRTQQKSRHKPAFLLLKSHPTIHGPSRLQAASTVHTGAFSARFPNS